MKINLELAQKQILSQKMIQSVEILQMNAQELNEYLNEVSLENPAIDIEAGFSTKKSSPLLPQETGPEGDVWEDTGDTLQEFLHEQLLTMRLDDGEMRIAEYIIGCLDSRGYFQEEISEVAGNLHAPAAEVGEVLAMLKQLEPPGVCAGSLQECLLNQLGGQDEISLLARRIIEGHLEQVGKNQITAIAKRLNVPAAQAEAACARIKELNPKPGNAFSSSERTKYIIPDVIVVGLGDGFEVLINDYYYPEISVGAYYRKLLKNGESGAASDYIYEKIRQAEWIKQCIGQRNETLLKVAKGIVSCQERFFKSSSGKLVVLKQAELAELLKIHESTVSRAVKDKYIQCSRGIFPMNHFFSKGIASKDRSGIVAVGDAKDLMIEFIGQEDIEKTYSYMIVEELMNQAGIGISRRTVTKYRNELGIKDVQGRKRFGKTAAGSVPGGED